MSAADDAHAIQTLKACYCASADRAAHDPAGARAALASVFAPDATGDYGVGPLTGADALAAYLCDAIAANSAWLVHMLHSPLIEIVGDTATGDWTVMVRFRRTDGARDEVVGRYSDAFRRTPEGWRIARVRFDRLE